MLRPKDKWSKNALLMDAFRRLGLELANSGMWDKYLFICDTTGPGCELADKAATLLTSEDNIKKIIDEIGVIYGK